MILNETLVTGALIAGGFFTVLFGYLFYLSPEPSQLPQVSMTKRYLGVFSLGLGTIMLIAWGYLILAGWKGLEGRIQTYLPHILLELVCGIGFFFSGLALIKRKALGSKGFIGSTALFLFSTISTLIEYGMDKHPMLMNGIAILVSLVLIYCVAMVYCWGNVILHWEENTNQTKVILGRRKAALR